MSEETKQGNSGAGRREASAFRDLLESHNVELPEWAAWAAQNVFGDWLVWDYVPVVKYGCWYAPDGNEKQVIEGNEYLPNWTETLMRI